MHLLRPLFAIPPRPSISEAGQGSIHFVTFAPFLSPPPVPMSQHVLVAEDDAFFRETIQLALEEHGVHVETSKHGGEAIAAMDKRQPDLLLLDLLMPHTDGFRVLAHVREMGYTFPVVILSNLSDDIDNEKCFSLGAKDYFIKSDMDEDELWPKIEKYLSPVSK